MSTVLLFETGTRGARRQGFTRDGAALPAPSRLQHGALRGGAPHRGADGAAPHSALLRPSTSPAVHHVPAVHVGLLPATRARELELHPAPPSSAGLVQPGAGTAAQPAPPPGGAAAGAQATTTREAARLVDHALAAAITGEYGWQGFSSEARAGAERVSLVAAVAHWLAAAQAERAALHAQVEYLLALGSADKARAAGRGSPSRAGARSPTEIEASHTLEVAALRRELSAAKGMLTVALGAPVDGGARRSCGGAGGGGLRAGGAHGSAGTAPHAHPPPLVGADPKLLVGADPKLRAAEPSRAAPGAAEHASGGAPHGLATARAARAEERRLLRAAAALACVRALTAATDLDGLGRAVREGLPAAVGMSAAVLLLAVGSGKGGSMGEAVGVVADGGQPPPSTQGPSVPWLSAAGGGSAGGRRGGGRSSGEFGGSLGHVAQSPQKDGVARGLRAYPSAPGDAALALTLPVPSQALGITARAFTQRAALLVRGPALREEFKAAVDGTLSRGRAPLALLCCPLVLPAMAGGTGGAAGGGTGGDGAGQLRCVGVLQASLLPRRVPPATLAGAAAAASEAALAPPADAVPADALETAEALARVVALMVASLAQLELGVRPLTAAAPAGPAGARAARLSSRGGADWSQEDALAPALGGGMDEARGAEARARHVSGCKGVRAAHCGAAEGGGQAAVPRGGFGQSLRVSVSLDELIGLEVLAGGSEAAAADLARYDEEGGGSLGPRAAAPGAGSGDAGPGTLGRTQLASKSAGGCSAAGAPSTAGGSETSRSRGARLSLSPEPDAPKPPAAQLTPRAAEAEAAHAQGARAWLLSAREAARTAERLKVAAGRKQRASFGVLTPRACAGDIGASPSGGAEAAPGRRVTNAGDWRAAAARVREYVAAGDDRPPRLGHCPSTSG